MSNWSVSKAVGALAGGVLLIVAVSVGSWCLGGSAGPDADKLADSPQARERVQSIEILGKSSDEAANDKLFQMSADKDTRVAMAAVWKLTERRRPEDRDALRRVLADPQRHARVRAEAASGLGLFKQTDPATLVQTLENEKDPRVRVGAAKGLLALRDLKSVPGLVKALEDPDERVRQWSIAALNKMMVRRFPYDYKLTPGEQRDVIAQIQHYTRHSSEADTTHIVTTPPAQKP